jgi:predicted ATPase/DNA-binding SARP family transcriptional activator
LASAARLKLILLGGFEARSDPGPPPLVLPTRKSQALLAYLALPVGRAHRREEIADLLWGGLPAGQARGNLRQSLARIRKTLPGSVQAGLVLDGSTISLDPAIVESDAEQLERLVVDGRPAALGQIADLYRGDLLAGLTVEERPFEDWLTSERERLRELAIQGLRRLLTHHEQADAREPALETGLRLLELDPLQEPVHRAVMRLQAGLGRGEAALRQYEICVDALKRELGTAPDADTVRLRDDVLHGRAIQPGSARGGRDAMPSADRRAPVAPVAETRRLTNLPASTTELIGRDATVAEVTTLLGTHRLVTLIGPGGIGKTRLAVEVARMLLPAYPDGAWVAELAPLTDPALVPVTVALALGLKLTVGAESPERVAAALGAKSLLLVLDNCEHVIEIAARMAEALLRANPRARVLATSREPLRTPGESAYRVVPLQVPTEGSAAHESILQSPAVQLFVARAQAADRRFSPDARSAAIAAAVCRRLDGMPLAIELAAACIAALGVEDLAARLNDRFRLLTSGHRTALPRHQTLRAALDWSYDLLSGTERAVLHRLAIFASPFTLEAASAVATTGDLDASAVVDGVANLAAKSLLVVEATGEVTRYRLLETTRAYALEKLGESDDLPAVARRHAEYYRDLFERAEAECETRSATEWLATYGRQIDNIRAALDWTFSPRGDTSIGVALTAAAACLWIQQSLLVECRGRAERALASLGPRGGRDARHEMQLSAALGVSLMHTKGASADTIAAWTTALEIAERLDDTEYQLRALWGLWVLRIIRGECRAALELARRFTVRTAGAADPADRLLGERITGTSLHYLGDQTSARGYHERMLAHYVDRARRSHTIRFQYDQKVAANLVLARILWLEGLPERAMRLAHENIEEARGTEHPLSLCVALEVACLIAIWSGDLASAERTTAELLDYSARHALTVRHRGARCIQGALLIERGRVGDGLEHLVTALDELRESDFVPYYPIVLGTFAHGLGRAGQIAQALATIDETLARSERSEERWYMAELVRIKAELVLLDGGPDADAEALLQRALQWTREQGVLSLQLRTAMSLARLRLRQGRPRDARDLLAPVYARFTEGFATADLEAAQRLLDRLT